MPASASQVDDQHVYTRLTLIDMMMTRQTDSYLEHTGEVGSIIDTTVYYFCTCGRPRRRVVLHIVLSQRQQVHAHLSLRPKGRLRG
jgi:hypothetical protein